MLCLKHQQENKNVDEKVRKQRKFNVVFLFAQIMQHLYPQYSWIAILIEMFITISITVSYLTVGAALHHTRESNFWVETRRRAAGFLGRSAMCHNQSHPRTARTRTRFPQAELGCKYVSYLSSWGPLRRP